MLTHVIIAEIVYILEKVYKIPKREIDYVLSILLNNGMIIVNDKELILLTLKYFSKYNLDFADAILLSYKRLKNYGIITFDKKLSRLVK